MKAAFLVAPGVVLGDLTPAHLMLSMIPGAEVHTVWKTKDVLFADFGAFPILATTTFDECPADLDVLFAPMVGPEVHGDRETIDFLADRGRHARWVMSVCGGALMLGVAGLLEGYRTATHWLYDELITRCGAMISPERVVVDRNRITSDGGSAAIEHALVMARHLVGEAFAKEMELLFEWDPQPQLAFGVGSPEKAGPELTERVRHNMSPTLASLRDCVEISIAERQRELVAAPRDVG